MTKGSKARTKGNSFNKSKSKDQLERKRDERARRHALKKEREAKEYLENDENFVSFSNQLQAIGYKIKDIKGDGNCLFRALADQLDGNDDGHLMYRRKIAKYLADNRAEFEPFVEDNRTFDEHANDDELTIKTNSPIVKELGKAGTFGGNDSIVAFSRCFGVNIVIHQLNERCWLIHGEEYRRKDDPKRELHISYHNGDHYSSVRRLGDSSDDPAWLYGQQKVSTPMETLKKEPALSKKLPKELSRTAKLEEATTSEISSDVAIIQASTDCQDLKLIQQALLESSYDLDSAISYILQLQSLEALPELTTETNDCKNDLDELTTSVDTTTEYCSNISIDSDISSGNTLKKIMQEGEKTRNKAPSTRRRKLNAKQEKKARRMEERRKEMKNKKLENTANNNEHTDNAVSPDFLDLEALAI